MTGPDARFMRMAIRKAHEGIDAGQTPFGACIVRDGDVIACEHNHVWANTDITAHAEVCAIRAACAATDNVDLGACVIYSTCEPCPMCFSACHWAGIRTIVYGARIADAAAAGFNELTVSNLALKELGGATVEIVPDFLRDEAAQLFPAWLAREDRKAY